MEKLLTYSGKDLQQISMTGWLRHKAAPLRPLALKWMEAIESCGADVQAIFHDGYPMGCVSQAPFAYVNAFSAHLNLGFFYGATLPDPKGLLEGQGKRMRHIKIRPGAEPDEQYLRRLLAAAYADIKQRLKENDGLTAAPGL